MPKIKVNGAEFYYEIHGAGHPMVLIAGYTCDHSLWQPILANLSEQFQVLIFDNRAAGQTKDAGTPLSTDVMAEDTILLCEHLNFHKPHVVGHSMGGSIVQAIGALYPDKISKLGILTSAVKLSERILFAFETILKMRKENVNIELIIDASLPWVYGEEFIKVPKNRDAVKKDIIENPFPLSIENQSRQFQLLQKIDSNHQLKQIQSPTLVVSGRQDVIAPSDESKWMASQIELSQFIELDCAHGIALEAPEQLVSAMMRFF